MLFRRRVDLGALAGQQSRQPFGRPTPLACGVDAGKRLQSHTALAVMKRASKILPVAAHCKRGGAD